MSSRDAKTKTEREADLRAMSPSDVARRCREVLGVPEGTMYRDPDFRCGMPIGEMIDVIMAHEFPG
jgi:hypothetical protein